MQRKLFFKTLIVLTLFVIAGLVSLYIEKLQSNKRIALVQPASSIISTTSPASADATLSCKEQMGRIYEIALQYLNNRTSPFSLDQTKDIIQESLRLDYLPSEFILVPLDENDRPNLLAASSCADGASDWHGTFRVLQSVSGIYRISVKSEDFAVLYSSRVDDAQLEVELLSRYSSGYSYFTTTWTRGSGRPAVFSIVVWEWNGQNLQPIWNKIDITNRTVKIISPLILLSGEGISQWEVYRLEKGIIISDGALKKELIESYVQKQLLTGKTIEDFDNIGYLWHAAGETDRAIQMYEKAISLDKTDRFAYLYLVIADLYDRQGNYSMAITTLQNYLTKRTVEPESKKKIEERIEKLKQRKQYLR